ncbi:MAG: type II toxin-antitoxin system RelB/DinJ family antitoxin [Lachnospiraceae bacterium]|nr:type II toxin-antitoxin system RelB/DinJ family antitoxin [Lachnospiraceae bacterium]
MNSGTFTFRIDEKLKREATSLYESLGMSLSSAINIFLKQSVLKKRFPCSIDLEVMDDYKKTYPKGFFELFGSGKDLDIEEPKELQFKFDKREDV